VRGTAGRAAAFNRCVEGGARPAAVGACQIRRLSGVGALTLAAGAMGSPGQRLIRLAGLTDVDCRHSA
jgi:hypothetical protein